MSHINNFGITSELFIRSEYLSAIDINKIIKLKNGTNSIILENWYFRQGNLTLYELYCICSLIKFFNVKNIFEIGTFDGLTTLHLALNSPDTCRIHTLDLPPDRIKDIKYHLTLGDSELVQKEGFEIGSYFKNHILNNKITQHYSDSATFEYSKFMDNFDFILIDGAHSYDYIKSDTKNAFGILKKEGIILWHDYGNILDVTNYLNDISHEINIHKIKDTSIVIYSNML